MKPLTGCYGTLMEWRGTRNVFGGVTNSQTSGVKLLHTQIPFPLQDQSQRHLWRDEGPCSCRRDGWASPGEMPPAAMEKLVA